MHPEPVAGITVRYRLLVAVLAFAGAAGADVFRPLEDPRESAQARADLIQQAEAEIHAMYFLARNDRITLNALALLREARRRGVGSVRLIVDAHYHRIPKAMLAHLRDEGVEVRVYHPLTLRHPSWLFRRMHEKVVIADRRRYITGGRNLAESYFGLAARKNFVDRDVYVEGASAEDADNHFLKVWDSKHVAALKVRVSFDEKKEASEVLDAALCDDFIELDTGTDWSSGQRRVDSVRFLHDPLVSEEGDRVADRLAALFEAAESSIVIESPYLVPSKSLLALLEQKSKEGVYVQIVTNSLRSTDGVLPQAAYLKYRRRLARSGIDVREFKGPDSLHAKTAVIDGRIVLIGSYNLDPRSQNLNSEVMCVAESEELAAEILDAIEIHVNNAWKVRGNGRVQRVQRDPSVSRARSFRAWAARLLLPIVENQL